MRLSSISFLLFIFKKKFTKFLKKKHTQKRKRIRENSESSINDYNICYNLEIICFEYVFNKINE